EGPARGNGGTCHVEPASPRLAQDQCRSSGRRTTGMTREAGRAILSGESACPPPHKWNRPRLPPRTRTRSKATFPVPCGFPAVRSASWLPCVAPLSAACFFPAIAEADEGLRTKAQIRRPSRTFRFADTVLLHYRSPHM